MRTSLAALGVLLFAAPGCYTFCDGSEMLAAAEAGEPAGIREVGELGDPVIPASKAPAPQLTQAYEALAPHLAADDPYRRLLAVESLRRLAARSRSLFRRSFAELLDGPLSDDDPTIRWRAAWTLGRLELSRPALRLAALDPDERVAERAVWALGRARDEGAPPYLLRALDREALQGAAMKALRRVTGQRLGDDPEAWRRSAAEAGVEPIPLPSDR